MRTLADSYQMVIEHVGRDILSYKKGGQTADLVSIKFLEKRQIWLNQRKDNLYNRQDAALCELKVKLEIYLAFCTAFWKTRLHFHESRQEALLEITKDIIKSHSYSGFEAYYTIFILFKKLRFILPPEHFKKHAVAAPMLQEIKKECMLQLRLYINPK